MHSCHLFLISSASVRSIPSVLYWAHLCMKCSLGISNFLEEISSLSHSVVFLYFFAPITEEGFLISPRYSLELCIQMGMFPFLLCFLLLFFSQLVVRLPQTTILLFCISFSWGWSWSLSPVQHHEPPSIAHQASLSFTISWSLLKLMSIASMMPSSHLILCCPLLLEHIACNYANTT